MKTVTAAVLGETAEVPKAYFKLWHGLVPALYMSIIATIGGAVLLLVFKPMLKIWETAPRPEAKVIFEWLVESIVRLAQLAIRPLHDGSFSRYAAFASVTIVVCGYYAWATGTVGAQTREMQPAHWVVTAGWLMLVAATLGLVLLHRQRLAALILMGIAGLMVSIGFVYFSAPDLAMTQFTVEGVTIVLLLLALNLLPKGTPKESTSLRRVVDGSIALAGGLAAFGLTYYYLLRGTVLPTISAFHVENSYKGGGGTNMVNVILVDFRGFDTYGEIIVLGIAALLIYALTEALVNGPVRARLLNRTPDKPLAGDMHPMMMVVLTRVMLPIVTLVGFYIFLRGHNEPGGVLSRGLSCPLVC